MRRKRDPTTLDTEEKGVLRVRGEDVRDGMKEKEEEVRVRNWWNIFRKWFTDCITAGALINTTLFLVVMGVLKGKAWSQIGVDLRTVSTLFMNFLCGSLLTMSIRKCGLLFGTRTKFGLSAISSARHIAPWNGASCF